MDIINKIEELLKKRISRIKFVGDIKGHLLSHPVYVNDKTIGESTKYPAVLELKIQNEQNDDILENLEEACKIVREKYFDFDFIFNVCFSCAKPHLLGEDLYADPYSIWFNIFFGYYEIDIPIPNRNYPFGFNSDFSINPEEILKIGKSDWNYFSNFVYGVPQKNITSDVTNILPSEINDTIIEKEIINNKEFYKLTINSFKVISAYEANNDEVLNREPNNLLWQATFGFPVSRKNFSKSFIPTNMKAVMYIYNQIRSHDDDLPKEEKEFSTFIFGGTINLDYPKNAIKNPRNTKTEEELKNENDRFLELQIKEIKKIIPKIIK